MLDEEIKSTKLWSTRRNAAVEEVELNETSNDSEEEELDDAFAGPSTSSNFRSTDHVNSTAAEDETGETNDPLKFRELLAEIRRMLDHDSVFNRIRSELLDELERLIRSHVNANADKKATRRQRFEFYEHLDDLVGTFTDLDESHLAVLHHTALQLAKHTPLEVVELDKEPEHLIVPPTRHEESFVDEVEVPTSRKSRKAKVVDEWNNSTVSMAKVEYDGTENEVNGETSTRNADALLVDHEPEPNGELEAVKSNGVHNDHEKTTKADIGEEDEIPLNGEKRTLSRSNSDYPLADAQMDDEKLMSPLAETVDDEPSSDSDAPGRSPLSKSRRDVKKTQRRSAYSKPNGVSKHTKEKSTNRKASERINKLKPEGDLKRKRRAAVVVATTSISELVGRPTSQRRNTRNANNQAAPDPETSAEPTYCLCDQISYGNMICCDNSECAIEWFHFDCVKLKVKPPKGKKWFCPSCKESTGKKNTR